MSQKKIYIVMISIMALVALLVLVSMFSGKLDASGEYRVYNVYDPNSNPIALRYTSLKLNEHKLDTVKAKELFLEVQKQNKEIIVPELTLLDVEMVDSVARLNFAGGTADLIPSGSLGEMLFKDLIINTLTELEGIDEVLFLEEGSALRSDRLQSSYEYPFKRRIEGSYMIYPEDTERLASFIFKDTTKRLFYEGGPSHWGSRTKVLSKAMGKLYTYQVTDESDLKGEDPKKVWTEIWEIKEDGLYIDHVKVLSNTMRVFDSWEVKKYKEEDDAKFEIQEVRLDEEGKIELTIQVTLLTTEKDWYLDTIVLKEDVGILKKTEKARIEDSLTIDLMYYLYDIMDINKE